MKTRVWHHYAWIAFHVVMIVVFVALALIFAIERQDRVAVLIHVINAALQAFWLVGRIEKLRDDLWLRSFVKSFSKKSAEAFALPPAWVEEVARFNAEPLSLERLRKTREKLGGTISIPRVVKDPVTDDTYLVDESAFKMTEVKP